MRGRQAKPGAALRNAQAITSLRMILIQREKWPPDAETLARSHGLTLALVNAEIAGEDLRRRMRG